MMEEIFKKIVKVVCDEMDIGYADLLVSRKETHVDARSILVACLVRAGMSHGAIALYLGMTRQGVNRLWNGFEGRIGRSWMLSMKWQRIRNEMASDNLSGN